VCMGYNVARFDRARFRHYGDSSLDFEIVYFVRSTDYRVYLDVQHEVNLGLFKQFGDEKIDFATPTQMLYLNVQRSSSPESRSVDASATPRIPSRRMG